ncbi:MAG: ribonuclease HII [Heliobacteriaceae bacterium]|nr:ribonuclease HII [Heliobacteriaceae bacterium]
MNNLFTFDQQFGKTIIGTDEAGRGPAAGGVFASAVCFPPRLLKRGLMRELSILNDSKKLTKKQRESIYDIILNETINSTVCIEVEEIEQINILNASLKAMKLACNNVVASFSPCEKVAKPDEGFIVLIDGNKLIKDFKHPQKFIIKGDGKSASIAAASVLAKVTRDRYMEELHEKFPQYNWAQNAGYLTAEHSKAIDKYGLTPHHRPSFLKKHFERQLNLF